MDHLSKQQIVLVALLVSFVTSLATGIITVSLMDQAPQSVPQTISQVIERVLVPQDATVATAPPPAFQDQTADAAAKASQSVVKLRSRDSGVIAGLGIVMTRQGVILADKSSIAGLNGYEAVMPNGMSIPLALVQSQVSGDIAFLEPSPPIASSTFFSPISYAPPASLGQTVFDLSGTTTPSLGQGIVSSVDPSTGTIDTTIPTSKAILGSPLFDINGAILGFETATLSQNDQAAFYPLAALKTVLPAGR